MTRFQKIVAKRAFLCKSSALLIYPWILGNRTTQKCLTFFVLSPIEAVVLPPIVSCLLTCQLPVVCVLRMSVPQIVYWMLPLLWPLHRLLRLILLSSLRSHMHMGSSPRVFFRVPFWFFTIAASMNEDPPYILWYIYFKVYMSLTPLAIRKFLHYGFKFYPKYLLAGKGFEALSVVHSYRSLWAVSVPWDEAEDEVALPWPWGPYVFGDHTTRSKIFKGSPVTLKQKIQLLTCVATFAWFTGTGLSYVVPCSFLFWTQNYLLRLVIRFLLLSL